MTPSSLAELMAETVATESVVAEPDSGAASSADEDAAVFADAEAWVYIRNLADARLVEIATVIGRRGMARRHGRRMTELMVVAGLVPSAASRIVRVSTRLPELSSATKDLAAGRMGAEMSDAIVKSMTLIERRSGGLDDRTRTECEARLLAQARSRATPAQVCDSARGIANTLAEDQEGGVDPATDRGSNELAIKRTDEGRLAITADIDATSGAVIATAIEALAKPRPEPDGSPDARAVGQRRVDALVQLASMTGTTIAKAQVSVIVPADAPQLPRIPWMGVVPPTTAAVLACDAKVEAIVVDGSEVPLAMGRAERTFPPALKRAIEVRDGGCVKCGAPAAWSHAHHIKYWSDGGNTDLDEGCLLCPPCHVAVHHDGWEIVMGRDRHPWLRPPSAVDPARRLLPSYYRRTMTIAA